MSMVNHIHEQYCSKGKQKRTWPYQSHDVQSWNGDVAVPTPNEGEKRANACADWRVGCRIRQNVPLLL